MATKLEAFKSRGKEDYFASHDLEDIISIIDGRPELIDELKRADEIIKSFLAEEFNVLLNNQRFREALPGHLYDSPAGSEKIVTERLSEISNLSALK